MPRASETKEMQQMRTYRPVPMEMVDKVVTVVASDRGVDINDVFKRKQLKEIVEVRNICAYIFSKQGYSQSAIGSVFGLDHSTVWHSIHSIEDGMNIYIGMREKIENHISQINKDNHEERI